MAAPANTSFANDHPCPNETQASKSHKTNTHKQHSKTEKPCHNDQKSTHLAKKHNCKDNCQCASHSNLNQTTTLSAAKYFIPIHNSIRFIADNEIGTGQALTPPKRPPKHIS